MAFNIPYYGGYVGRSWDPVERGVHSLTYSSHASTYPSDESTYSLVGDLNDSIIAASPSYNSVSTMKSILLSYELELFMIPTHGSMAESMTGVSSASNLTNVGYFNYGAFQSNDYLTLSSGFSNSNLNDRAWYGFCGFNGSTFYGTCIVVYTGYSGSHKLREFWYPNQDRPYKAFVLQADDSENEYVSTQSTIYSDNQQPSTYGYRLTNRWAQDDGAFGFKANVTRLDGNGGPYHQTNYSTNHSYGCENPNAGDGAADDFYWKNQAFISTSYSFYAFCQFEP